MNNSALRSIALAGTALALMGSASAAQKGEHFDVVVRHGTIFDGTGTSAYKADVGIRNGYIAAIGDLSSADATKEIDARDSYVAPGFINIHDHSTAQGIRLAKNMLTQGVTLGVGNADGGGSVDLPKEFADYAANGMAMNLALSIGFNSVWSNVMGPSDHRPTKDEVAKMQALLVAGLENGATGVAAGLDYKPAYFSTVPEAIEVLTAASRWRTFFPNHDRVSPPKFSSHDGMMETIEIASHARVMPEITHIKSQGHEQGQGAAVVKMIDDATAAGHYTAADIYPYLAGMTGVGNLLIPGWAQDGGREAMLKRFGDPETRRRIASEAEEAMRERIGGPAGIYLPQTKEEFTDIMRRESAGAGETLIRVLEKGNPLAVLRFGLEDDLVTILKHPATAIACDCGADDSQRGAHPRGYGTFPKILGEYVRDRKVLTWENAIRKMSGLPASTAGFVDRGFISTGMKADITVFDPSVIRANSTYEAPFTPSEGVRSVIVNGKVALEAGQPNGVQAGEKVVLSRHMPSRPMATVDSRLLSGTTTFHGPSGDLRVSMDVRQTPNDRQAKGHFEIKGSNGANSLIISRFGLLQVTHGWASFTGWARTAAGEEHPVTIILDSESPGGKEGDVTLTILNPQSSTESTASRDSVKISPVKAYR